MQLEELRIRKATYGKNEGNYVGHAEFSNEKGKVDLALTPEHCEKIFKICAEGIIEVATQAAEELTVSVIDHQKSLSDKE